MVRDSQILDEHAQTEQKKIVGCEENPDQKIAWPDTISTTIRLQKKRENWIQ